MIFLYEHAQNNCFAWHNFDKNHRSPSSEYAEKRNGQKEHALRQAFRERKKACGTHDVQVVLPSIGGSIELLERATGMLDIVYAQDPVGAASAFCLIGKDFLQIGRNNEAELLLTVVLRFLPKYLERHNKRFMVTAAAHGDMHRPLPKRIDLNRILCIKTERTVRNDNTISLDGKLYQLDEALAGYKVSVEERVDGTMRIMNQDKSIRHHAITERPQKVQLQTSQIYKSKAHKPAADHPWIGTFFGKKRSHKKPALSVAI